MTQTLYGDVLFLINFSMDFLTLFITARILNRRIKVGRMAFSAAVGGVYGVASCFMGGWLIFSIAVNFAVSLLMCYIAFSEKIFPCCALFYGTGCLLGGVMTAVCELVNRINGTRTVRLDGRYQAIPGDPPIGWMAVTAVIAGIIAVFMGKTEKKRRAASRVALKIVLFGKSLDLTGITDSGNLLTDPISGTPVIILSAASARDILPDGLAGISDGELPETDDLPPGIACRLRLIPYKTASGEGVLPALRPDSVSVDGAEKTALAAFSGIRDFDGEDALVPYTLL